MKLMKLSKHFVKFRIRIQHNKLPGVMTRVNTESDMIIVIVYLMRTTLTILCSAKCELIRFILSGVPICFRLQGSAAISFFFSSLILMLLEYLLSIYMQGTAVFLQDCVILYTISYNAEAMLFILKDLTLNLMLSIYLILFVCIRLYLRKHYYKKFNIWLTFKINEHNLAITNIAFIKNYRNYLTNLTR